VQGLEQHATFDNIKFYLASPLVLLPPQLNMLFFIYLSAEATSIDSMMIEYFGGK
jgi:hypothetical protein